MYAQTLTAKIADLDAASESKTEVQFIQYVSARDKIASTESDSQSMYFAIVTTADSHSYDSIYNQIEAGAQRNGTKTFSATTELCQPLCIVLTNLPEYH